MRKTSMFIAINLFIIVFKVYAAWQGPSIVLEGGWGAAAGQFGVRSGDTADEFPSMVAISSSGRVLIGDGFNIRIQVFNADGTVNSIITPNGFPTTYRSATYWPLSIFNCGDQNIYTERNEYIQIYSLSGELLQNMTNLDGGIVSIDQQCNFYTHNPSAKRYTLYSPSGQLIKTSAERPLELGRVKSEKLGEKKYKITITYADKVYGLSSDRKFLKYVRDANGKVYGINPGGAWRFNQCGKLEGLVKMPKADIDKIPGEGREEPQAYVNSEYGSPVVAPNGYVYAWKRTPDKYSILKWTWVDDPNVPTGPDAPTGLTLMPSTTGLYLTWTASPSDPGCVTGYEVARATSAGGVDTTVGTVTAGTVKYNDTTASAGTMYYYKIRAVAGSEYSPFTAEVSGKR